MAEHSPLLATPNRQLIQRKADAPAPVMASLPPLSHGAPLPDHIRSPMEAGFGRDFGAVRLHDDARAHDSARDHHARAYASGNDIVFGPGQYRPETPEGRGLIAHELAHVAQSGGTQFKPEPGATAPAANPALEAEADRAAEAVTAGRPAPTLTRANAPMLLRSDEATPAPPAAGPSTATAGPVSTAKKLPPGMTALQDDQNGAGGRLEIAVDNFTLPVTKGDGPWVKAAFDAVVAGGRCNFIPQYDGKKLGAFKEKVGSSTYTDMWLRNYGFSSSKAMADAIRASTDAEVVALREKDAEKTLLTKLDKSVANADCNVDHIVEKQIGGSSDPANLQLLNKEVNQKGGGQLYLALSDLVAQVRRPEFRDKNAMPFMFVMKKINLLPATDHDPALSIEKMLRKPGAIPGGREPGSLAPDEKLVSLSAGGLGETERILDKGSTTITTRARYLIPGMSLDSYTRGPNGKPDTVTGELRHDALKKANNKNTTILLDAKPGTATIAASAAGEAAADNAKASEIRALTIQSGSVNKEVHFWYPYLSPGKLTKLWLDDKGQLNGIGTITPNLKFLPELNIEMGPDTLRLLAPIKASEMKLPGNILRFTGGALGLELAPNFVPSGDLQFEVGPAGKPVIKGDLRASYKDGVFIFEIKMVPARPLPGVQEAKGEGIYRSDTGWSGFIKASSTAIPRSTLDVELGFTPGEKGLTPYAKGGLITQLRDDTRLELNAGWDTNGLRFSGGATMLKPMAMIDKVELKGGYANEVLTLHGEADFHFKKLNLNSKMKIGYTRKDGEEGKFAGQAIFNIQTEKMTGKLDLNFDAAGAFWGGGELSYQLTPHIRPKLGATFDKRGKLELTAGVELADIALGRKWPSEQGGRLDLIKGLGAKFNFPTPVSPAVNAIIELNASLGIGYSVGPVMLRGVRLEGRLFPLEDDPQIAVTLAGRLELPAEGSIFGTFGAYIGAEVPLGMVGVKGGIEVTPKVTITATGIAKVDAKYDSGGFDFEAQAMAEGALNASLKIDLAAVIYAAGGLLSYKWVYNIGDYKKELVPKMTLHLGRFAYGRDGKITWPDPSQIRAEPKDFDTKALIWGFLDKGKANSV